jgi:succinate dehydrogenase/fumarate reductase flavoprotein subunit
MEKMTESALKAAISIKSFYGLMAFGGAIGAVYGALACVREFQTQLSDRAKHTEEMEKLKFYASNPQARPQILTKEIAEEFAQHMYSGVSYFAKKMAADEELNAIKAQRDQLRSNSSSQEKV